MKTTSFAASTFLAALLLLTACGKKFEDCHNSIYIENKSAAAVYYVSTLKEGFLNYDPSNPTHAADYKVTPGATQKIRIGIALSCWEQVMESANGHVYIYIYDAAEMESQGWSNIKDKPLKKYTLSAAQLNKMGWKISYP